MPSESTEGSLKYVQGSNPSETFLSSKLENPAKRNHAIPFTHTTQTILMWELQLNVQNAVDFMLFMQRKIFYTVQS